MISLVLDVQGYSKLGGFLKVGGIELAADGELGVLLGLQLIEYMKGASVVQPDLCQASLIQPLLVPE